LTGVTLGVTLPSMIAKGKKRVFITLDKTKLKEFKRAARNKNMTLSALVTEKLSDTKPYESYIPKDKEV